MDPPTYSLSPSTAADEGLPDYAELFNTADRVSTSGAPRRRTTHVFGVRSRRDGPEWFKLRVVSRAKHAGQLPICCEGDPVVGSVELDLEQEMTIKSVNISVSHTPYMRNSQNCRVLTQCTRF